MSGVTPREPIRPRFVEMHFLKLGHETFNVTLDTHYARRQHRRTVPCSVFLFEKCIAEKLHKPRRREIVTNVLKREVRLLTQLRHPYLLHVICPIEETK
ncbi:uncharacterized protein DEA37_0002135 [Paragonimus westermani]|uniref:Protein kinase domain-containing protein n=1 Tax=Paragonimus westermani TaxID=34504 RepID=A0A5J4P0P8_9TREM|nr:uncharacterized protein DEA37_0002135 [Paragonimus westermani]